jgi:flavin reductase (DIM6/NTAB) family NADH-FMN oxidoreductase RutF
MDEEAKEQALRLFPYGLHIVGVRAETVDDPAEDHYAFLGSWVTQCSFDPPLVAVAVRQDSDSHPRVLESGVLTLNPLRRDQKDVARDFIKNVKVGDGTMEGLPYEEGEETGAPIFPDAAATLELEIQEVADGGGDHTIVIGRVVAATCRDDSVMLRSEDTGMSYAG